MNSTNIFVLGTQKGVRVYRGRDDQWEEDGRHLSGVADCLEGSKLHPETIYCCILHDGVYRTVDAGKSWLRVFEGDARSAAVDPADDRVVYVGTEPVHLYRSDNRGDTWEDLEGLLDLPEEVKCNWKSPQPQYQGHVRHIHIDAKNPQNLYLSIEHGGIVRSFDRGITWEDVSKGIDCLDIHKVSNDPVREDLYFVTSARGFFRTSDPTRGWTRKEETGITRDYFHDFVFLPGYKAHHAHRDRQRVPWILESSGNGSAIFRSLDGGESWHQVGDGLPESMEKMVWTLAVPPGNPAQVYAGLRSERQGTSGDEKNAYGTRRCMVLSGPGKKLPRNRFRRDFAGSGHVDFVATIRSSTLRFNPNMHWYGERHLLMF